MGSPEILRIILMTGLAVVTYLMILAWNDDMEAAKAPSSYSEAPLTTQAAEDALNQGVGNAPTPTPSTDVPSTVPAPATGATDVPDNALLGNGPQAPTAQSPLPASALAVVETEVLKIWIDLQGGDIVRVQLPKFPVELEQPDVPYQLLEQSGTRTYVAQSGLIGDGPEGAGLRPIYAASARELRVGAGETRELTLTAKTDTATITKTYVFRGDDYLLDLNYAMRNDSSASMTSGMYAQIKRDARTPEHQDSFALAPQPYLGAATTTPDERYRKLEFEDSTKTGDSKRSQGGWVAVPAALLPGRLGGRPSRPNRTIARGDRWQRHVHVRLRGPADGGAGAARPGSASSMPVRKTRAAWRRSAPNLNLTVDYGFLWWLPCRSSTCWIGSIGYRQLGGCDHSADDRGQGVALSAVRGWLQVHGQHAPGGAADEKTAGAVRQRPREAVAGDDGAVQEGEGPTRWAGVCRCCCRCRSSSRLYWVLFESVELRQAPFLLWIEDLATMDPYFVLPLLMGASTYLMQSMSPQVGDPDAGAR